MDAHDIYSHYCAFPFKQIFCKTSTYTRAFERRSTKRRSLYCTFYLVISISIMKTISHFQLDKLDKITVQEMQSDVKPVEKTFCYKVLQKIINPFGTLYIWIEEHLLRSNIYIYRSTLWIWYASDCHCFTVIIYYIKVIL